MLLALSLLTGCSSMLNREYVSVSPHDQFSGTGTDSSSLRAENYQGLVNAILYLVSQRAEKGTIRLYNYTWDVEADLSKACLEVTKEDPLGAYAVDYIKYDFARIVSYYEATVQIAYRRSPEEMKGVVLVTGSSAIKSELREALLQFAPEAALRVSYFTEDKDYIVGLVRQAYYDTPEAAFGLPQTEVELYPDSGPQRIVALTLTYPDSADKLRQMRETLAETAGDFATRLRAEQGTMAAAIHAFLRGHVLYQGRRDADSSTAYAALVDGRADSEGLALAFHLLCRLTGVESMVVPGTRDGKSCFWNLVETRDGWRHVDASWTNFTPLTDAAMKNAGYAWDAGSFPVCS